MKINIVKNDPIFQNIDTLFGCMILFFKNKVKPKSFVNYFVKNGSNKYQNFFDTHPTIVKICASCLMLFQVAL
jgi:hypothetical protein